MNIQQRSMLSEYTMRVYIIGLMLDFIYKDTIMGPTVFAFVLGCVFPLSLLYMHTHTNTHKSLICLSLQTTGLIHHYISYWQTNKINNIPKNMLHKLHLNRQIKQTEHLWKEFPGILSATQAYRKKCKYEIYTFFNFKKASGLALSFVFSFFFSKLDCLQCWCK